MPEVAAIIQYGDITDIPIRDEPDLLVQSLVIVPSYTKEVYRGIDNKATQVLHFTDPILTFQFNAIIAAPEAFAAQVPGEMVSELENFTGPLYKFSQEDGIMVYEDPITRLEQDEAAQADFNVVHYPFVGGAAEMLWSDNQGVRWSDNETVEYSDSTT